MESWDDEDFKPPVVAPVVPVANKWEGEDEDDDVKDNWEDEDEEKQRENASEVVEVKKSKKKSLAEKIAERERIKREEMARRVQLEDEEDISPEELRRREIESDLKLALDTTFGGGCVAESLGDGLTLPSTKEEFQEFAETLSKKLTPLSKNVEYPQLVENLMRNLCATMSSLDIKKVKNSLDNLYLEKQKIEKGDKLKKNKGKGKAKLKLEGDNEQLSAYVDDFDYDDYMS